MSTHDYTLEDELESETTKKDIYKYEVDEYTKNLKDIDLELSKIKDNEEKIKYINDKLVNYQKKNRFYV